MKKKKIISAIAGLAIVASVAAGSYAYFTSTQSIVNNFTTSKIDRPGANNGVTVHEHFDKKAASQALPGIKVSKQVTVQNTATYNQYVKVIITANSKNGKVLNAGDIDLYFNQANIGTTTGKWIVEKPVVSPDGTTATTTCYFVGQLQPGQYTPELLNSVELNGSLTNAIEGIPYNVTVKADTTQITDAKTGAEDGALLGLVGNDKTLANEIASGVYQGSTVNPVPNSNIVGTGSGVTDSNAVK